MTFVEWLIKSVGDAPRASIDDYVKDALAAHRTQIGQDESLNDIVGPAGIATFQSEEAGAIAQFFIIRDALDALAAARRSDDYADPVVTAAMRLFLGDQPENAEEQARRRVDLHLKLRDLPIDDSLRPASPRRGQPPRDPRVEAAVRGAMHWLSDQGLKCSGSWTYPDRESRRMGKRSQPGELLPVNNAAKEVLAAVSRSCPDADASQVKRHMEVYTALLNREGRRKPRRDDYTMM